VCCKYSDIGHMQIILKMGATDRHHHVQRAYGVWHWREPDMKCDICLQEMDPAGGKVTDVLLELECARDRSSLHSRGPKRNMCSCHHLVGWQRETLTMPGRASGSQC